MEFGIESKTYEDSAWEYWFVEPFIKININSNSYAALYYNYTDQYTNPAGDKSKTHWLNIRVGYIF